VGAADATGHRTRRRLRMPVAPDGRTLDG